jgi:hypothetical protein
MVANVARINDHKKRHFEKLRQIIANAATWLPHIVALNPTAFAHSGPLSSGWKDKSAADIALTSLQGNLPNTASGL